MFSVFWKRYVEHPLAREADVAEFAEKRKCMVAEQIAARVDSAVTRQIMDTGVRVMLTKPVDADELVDHIRSAIGDS